MSSENTAATGQDAVDRLIIVTLVFRFDWFALRAVSVVRFLGIEQLAGFALVLQAGDECRATVDEILGIEPGGNLRVLDGAGDAHGGGEVRIVWVVGVHKINRW